MRALISVSDKTGIVELAGELASLGVEIISTGGTYAKLQEAGISAIEISELTGFPECLDGRVKTLHPAVHAGLLAMRANPDHMRQISELNIEPIDMVIVNLYPFKETIMKSGVTRAEAVENIDIGGPTMLRSAAKNYQDVAVVVDPADYTQVLAELKERGEVSLETKFYLMQKVFMHTSNYDTMIADYLKKERGDDTLPETLTMTFEKVQDMRYGENPHQKAAFTVNLAVMRENRSPMPDSCTGKSSHLIISMIRTALLNFLKSLRSRQLWHASTATRAGSDLRSRSPRPGRRHMRRTKCRCLEVLWY